jgi:hypothetical protein
MGITSLTTPLRNITAASVKSSSTTLGPINLFEFETLAKERLPKEEYDYIAGGATDEISVDRNRRAYESWALRPRVLQAVTCRSRRLALGAEPADATPHGLRHAGSASDPKRK